MESNLESFTGVMDLRDAMLQELGIYEMYRLMKLYHDWESVVGPMTSKISAHKATCYRS